jgi:hypothetical protein
MAHLEIIPHHSNDDATVVHPIANIVMESEGESIFHIRMFANSAMMDWKLEGSPR